jgi:glycosyltransferase involved in cell wall biosynthesis
MSKKNRPTKTKALKIVHIVSYFQPMLGYEEFYSAYFQKKLGHDVYVITSERLFPFKNIETMLKQAGEKDTKRIRRPGYSVVEGIKVYRQPVKIETLYDFILIKGIKDLLAKIKPDIVHCHEPKEGVGYQGAYYSAKLGFPFVVDSHDFYYDEHPLVRNMRSWKDMVAKWDYLTLRKHLARNAYKKADKIIAVTSDVKDFAVGFSHADPKKVIVTSLGADTENFNLRPEGRASIRKRFGFSDSDVVLFFSGIITRRKKAETIISLFTKMNKKYPHTRLMIVGEGEEDYFNDLKDLAKRSGIEGKIVFTGFVGKKELPDYMSASDIGIWFSNNSVVMMEAISCGLPVVIPDLQLSHIVGYNDGFKFKPGDERQFLKYVEKLIKDSDLRKRMSMNARVAAVAHYSYKTNAEKLIGVYTGVINKHKKVVK